MTPNELPQVDLPPLPDSSVQWSPKGGTYGALYTSSDMREYARTALSTLTAQGGDAKNVHTEHCCAVHGCKYGDDNCPIETRQQRQSYPCEQCDRTTPPAPSSSAVEGLVAKWRERANRKRQCGLSREARLDDAHADELEQALTSTAASGGDANLTDCRVPHSKYDACHNCEPIDAPAMPEGFADAVQFLRTELCNDETKWRALCKLMAAVPNIEAMLAASAQGDGNGK